MEAEVINKITDLVREAEAKVVTIDGQEYTTVPLHDARKPLPEPEPFRAHTLTGFLNYLLPFPVGMDELDPKDHVVQVRGPTEVRYVSRVFGHHQQRFTYATATTVNLAASSALFGFERFLPAEDFTIALQALFQDSHDRARVLQISGLVQDSKVSTQEDDGVTQAVQVKAGLSFKEEMKIPNPVTLVPFRTFREVEQPASTFILRGKPGGKPGGAAGALFGLFEADGRAWELEAIANIARFLQEKLPNEIRVIS